LAGDLGDWAQDEEQATEIQVAETIGLLMWDVQMLLQMPINGLTQDTDVKQPNTGTEAENREVEPDRIEARRNKRRPKARYDP
jgi:hypothetical protein